MGRVRQAIIKGHKTKAEKEQRLNSFSGTGTDLSAPNFLSADAKQEFYRVVNACKRLGTLDELDLSVLAIYADAYDNYCRLTKIIAETGPVIVKRRVTGVREVYNNPAVTTQAEYVHRIMQCSIKLGLAVTDRMRIEVPKDDDIDEFSQFEGDA